MADYCACICLLAASAFSHPVFFLIRNTVGIPAFMYVLQMLANVGGKAENAKYFTFFTLFNPDGMIAGESGAIAGIFVLFAGSVMLYVLGIMTFERKDLHI